MVLAHSRGIAVISAYPILQKIWKLWRHCKPPGSLILTCCCASTHFKDFSCHHLLPNPHWVQILQPARHSLGLYYLFSRFLPLPAAPCLPFPAVSQHRPLGPAVFSLQREQGERTIPSVSAIPNVLCYILLCCTGRKKDVAEHSSMSKRNEAK